MENVLIWHSSSIILWTGLELWHFDPDVSLGFFPGRNACAAVNARRDPFMLLRYFNFSVTLCNSKAHEVVTHQRGYSLSNAVFTGGAVFTDQLQTDSKLVLVPGLSFVDFPNFKMNFPV